MYSRVCIIAAAVAITLAQVPGPAPCSGTSNGPYVYTTVGSDGQEPGYTISVIDLSRGCSNSTLHSDSTYYLDTYSAIACYPNNVPEFTYPIRDTAGPGGNKYWETFNDGTLNSQGDFVSAVKMSYSTSAGSPIIFYSTGGSTYRIGTLGNSKGKVGNVIMTFNVDSSYSFNNIAAWDDDNQVWYGVAFDKYTNDAEMYIINTVTRQVRSVELPSLIPADMFATSTGIYLVYTTGGVNQCNQNYVPPRPTNPRLRVAQFARVSSSGSITMVGNINFHACLRLHAISGYDTATNRYIFYAQEDFSSSNYHNGVGYVKFSSSTPTGNVTAKVSGYWGDGIGLAPYAFCPA